MSKTKDQVIELANRETLDGKEPYKFWQDIPVCTVGDLSIFRRKGHLPKLVKRYSVYFNHRELFEAGRLGAVKVWAARQVAKASDGVTAYIRQRGDESVGIQDTTVTLELPVTLKDEEREEVRKKIMAFYADFFEEHQYGCMFSDECYDCGKRSKYDVCLNPDCISNQPEHS